MFTQNSHQPILSEQLLCRNLKEKLPIENNSYKNKVSIRSFDDELCQVVLKKSTVVVRR